MYKDGYMQLIIYLFPIIWVKKLIASTNVDPVVASLFTSVLDCSRLTRTLPVFVSGLHEKLRRVLSLSDTAILAAYEVGPRDLLSGWLSI